MTDFLTRLFTKPDPIANAREAHHVFVVIGEDDHGVSKVHDFTTSGTLLATGQTGSGLANFTEGVLMTDLLRSYSSSKLQYVLIDPTQIQFSPYLDIPQLFLPLATTPADAEKVIDKLLEEHNTRHRLLANNRSRDLIAYNASGIPRALPDILLAIDEFVDLMKRNPEFYEQSLAKLIETGREVGIHVYLSSQSSLTDPSITRLANSLPQRLVFRGADDHDETADTHRTLNDEVKRIGDSYYMQPGAAPQLIHTRQVTDVEIKQLVKSYEPQTPRFL